MHIKYFTREIMEKQLRYVLKMRGKISPSKWEVAELSDASLISLINQNLDSSDCFQYNYFEQKIKLA